MIDILHEPALKAPPGVISQFPTTSSDEQSWWYVGVTISMIVPGILLLLRLYTKLYVVRKVDLTDYLIIISFLLFIAFTVCGRLGVAEGAGVHQWNLPLDNVIRAFHWTYVCQIIYKPTILFIKTALLLQYLGLFAPHKGINPFMWYCNRVMIVANGIFYISGIFIITFACSPREAYWDPVIKKSRCINIHANVLSRCVYNIVSDIIILIIPSTIVWKLWIPTKKKIEIVLLFAIGLLACIANGMVIVYINRSQRKNADVSYNVLWESLWSSVEISFGIIVTCMFTLPKFIEAKGAKIRMFCSSLMWPLKFFRSEYLRCLFQRSKNNAPSEGMTINRVDTSDHSAGDISISNRDQDLENGPSEDDSYEFIRYPSVKAGD